LRPAIGTRRSHRRANRRVHRRFRPGQTIRDEILRRLAEPATLDTAEVVRRRAALDERRRRVRDLYELGDLDRDEYLARRQAIDTELDSLAPGLAPDIDAARRVLDDFSLFWRQEPDPEPRRQLLQHLFERVWIDDKRVVAVPQARLRRLLCAGSSGG
jgi:hypothetical protein